MSEKLSEKRKKVDEKQSGTSQYAGIHEMSNRKERDSEEIDDLFMAKCHLNIQKLPDKALKRA